MAMLGAYHVRQTLQTEFESSNAVEIPSFFHGRQQRMAYGGNVRSERQILSHTWGGGVCRGALGPNARWLT